MSTKTKSKSVFDIKDVTYTNLKGEVVHLPLDNEHLASVLYDNATTLGVHVFAEELYKNNGKAEFRDEQTKEAVKEMVSRLFVFRWAKAINDQIDKL